jgi:hypothetical protein
MKLENLILVSIDDHAIEPAGAFAHHMPAKYEATTYGSSRAAPPAIFISEQAKQP